MRENNALQCTLLYNIFPGRLTINMNLSLVQGWVVLTHGVGISDRMQMKRLR